MTKDPQDHVADYYNPQGELVPEGTWSVRRHTVDCHVIHRTGMRPRRCTPHEMKTHIPGRCCGGR